MKRIKLTKGKVALVDDCDYEILNSFKWCASFGSRNRKWYAVRWLQKHEKALYGNRQKISMHQMLMWPPPLPGMIVDHKAETGEEAGLDNQRGNLEWTTPHANMLKTQGWKRREDD